MKVLLLFDHLYLFFFATQREFLEVQPHWLSGLDGCLSRVRDEGRLEAEDPSSLLRRLPLL